MLARRLLIGTAALLLLGIVASQFYMRANPNGADEEGLDWVLLYAICLTLVGLISWAVGYFHARRKGDDPGAACAWGALGAILVLVFAFLATLGWIGSEGIAFGHRSPAALVWIARLVTTYPQPWFVGFGIVLPYALSAFIAGRFRRRWAGTRSTAI